MRGLRRCACSKFGAVAPECKRGAICKLLVRGQMWEQMSTFGLEGLAIVCVGKCPGMVHWGVGVRCIASQDCEVMEEEGEAGEDDESETGNWLSLSILYCMVRVLRQVAVFHTLVVFIRPRALMAVWWFQK